MAAKILELIDKKDNAWTIRDEIAAILALESAKQQELATAGGKDPRLWALRVFIERSNPYAEFETAPEQLDATPIVNVWFDSSSVQLGASDLVERQRLEGVFNIDVYGYGVSEESVTGHIPGDERAARELQRAVQLVRNIIHAGAYTYLGLRGTVARRYAQTITAFQPQIDGRTVQQVQAARIALRVEFNEFSPQVQGQPLELIFVSVKRKENGQLFFDVQYGTEDS